MSKPVSIAEQLGRSLTVPNGGIAGLVNELLKAAVEQEVHFRWQTGCCHVSFPKGDLMDGIKVPLQNSVMRAVLARFAALCNERHPNSVSPYEGESEIIAERHRERANRVTFTNTPDTQSLALGPVTLATSELDGN